MVGGLVGWNSTNGRVENCYARANIYGTSNKGGLIGYNQGSVKYSYSTGRVTGNDQCGGFVGQNKGAITHSYYDKETSGKNDRGNGFVPRTTAQMKTEQNFVEWDFLNIWYIEPDQYPRLRL